MEDEDEAKGDGDIEYSILQEALLFFAKKILLGSV